MGILIPVLLLAVPILEIAVFILVGGQIGVFPTLAMILVTAVFGTILLRVQGFALIARIRGEMQANRVPGRELVHGAMLLAAGLLLLTPGFVTDSIGFLLFIPPIRDSIWAFAASRLKDAAIGTASGRTGGGPDKPPAGSARTPAGRPHDSEIVELDPADFERKPDPSSPWRDTGSNGR